MRRRNQIVGVLLAALCAATTPVLAEETEGSSIAAESESESSSIAAESESESSSIAAEPETDAESGELLEEDPYDMEPDREYFFDLDGNGEAESIRYETYTDEAAEGELRGPKGVLDIYQNDHLLYTLKGNEGTYAWRVSRYTLADERTYLLAYCKSDNDWTDQAFLLSQKDEDSLTVEGELCDLTRGENGFLSGWARLTWMPVKGVDEDRVAVAWCDTTNVTGNIYIAIEYQMTEEGIQTVEPPYSLVEFDKEWTAYRDFTTVKEPDLDEPAFDVQAGDVVKLTAITSVEGTYYLECVNQDGETGWLKDSEEIEMDPENQVWGYFEEAVFAG